MGDQKVPSADLDQIHLPDPVLNDIRQLQTDNIRLKKELKALKEKLAKEKIIEENQVIFSFKVWIYEKGLVRKLWGILLLPISYYR